ncbi:hypothetical protein [Apilactobacillus quenuiae]|uniref:hypothetical protein n=1 Tax=Apilactobacillus quenuiae TaxID=2008377 RepID=UPI0013000AFD|nr:hypothetical protein [Apilactobacillus quenuiae]
MNNELTDMGKYLQYEYQQGVLDKPTIQNYVPFMIPQSDFNIIFNQPTPQQ